MRGSPAILLGLLAGCADDPASAAPPPVEPGSAQVEDLGPRAPKRPGPHTQRGHDAVALNADCVSCHATEARAWQGSMHQRANDNLAYREAFLREGSPAFCTSCHAPEATDPRAPTAAEGDLGVGCVSCHVVDGVVLSARAPTGPAPHEVEVSADFATTGGCAGCHEFRFPGLSGHDPQAFMQTTVRELADADPAAACNGCHMPEGDHGFAQVRDPSWLAKGLRVDAAPLAEGDGIELRLSLPEPSHAYPTGDLFRRLQVGVEWRDDRGRVVERQLRYLARHFQDRPEFHHGRLLTSDDRVHLGVRRLRFDRPAPHAASRRWWVALQRVASIGRGDDPEAASIESEQRIADGHL